MLTRVLPRIVIPRDSSRLLSSLTSFGATREQKNRDLIDKIIRVDHAGELGADRIYAGQMAVLGRTDVGPTIQVNSPFDQHDRHLFPHLLQHMWDEEKAHLAKFNELIPKYKVRPSALLPLWNVAGYALGKEASSA